MQSAWWFIGDLIPCTFFRGLAKCSPRWCLILVWLWSSDSIRARIWRILVILDPRHLSRPSRFDGTEEGRYDQWRFQLVAYLAALDPRFGEVAGDVERRTTPYVLTDLPPDEDGKQAYLMLYSVIVGCIKNRPLRLIMKTESRDGRQALRKLDAEYRSTYRGRQMALLQRTHTPASEQCWFRCRVH